MLNIPLLTLLAFSILSVPQPESPQDVLMEMLSAKEGQKDNVVYVISFLPTQGCAKCIIEVRQLQDSAKRAFDRGREIRIVNVLSVYRERDFRSLKLLVDAPDNCIADIKYRLQNALRNAEGNSKLHTYIMCEDQTFAVNDVSDVMPVVRTCMRK